MSIQVDLKHLNGFVRNEEMEGIAPQVKTAHHMLHNGTGMGNDYIGWLALPTNYDKEEFERIQKAAKQIQSDTDILIVIGIGGSYLGARAAMSVSAVPPHRVMLPESALIRRQNARSSVVLPQPFGPRMPVTSPRRSSPETPRRISA